MYVRFQKTFADKGTVTANREFLLLTTSHDGCTYDLLVPYLSISFRHYKR